jgi:hypothetical protein
MTITNNTTTSFTYVVGVVSLVPTNYQDEQLPLYYPLSMRTSIKQLNMYGYMIK